MQTTHGTSSQVQKKEMLQCNFHQNLYKEYNYDIMVYNLTGQLVLQDTGLDNKHTIDTTNSITDYILTLLKNEEK
jgi:hypothetical protein